MKFKCEGCGAETSIGGHGLPTSLACQQCGCFDITFDCRVEMTPVKPDQEFGPAEISEANTPTLGRNFWGSTWVVREMKEIPQATKNTPLGTSPVKEETPSRSGGPTSEPPKPKKRTARDLRGGRFHFRKISNRD